MSIGPYSRCRFGTGILMLAVVIMGSMGPMGPILGANGSQWIPMDTDISGDRRLGIFNSAARSSVEDGERIIPTFISLSSYRPIVYLANAPFAIRQLALLPRRVASRSLISLLITPYLHRPARWRRFIPPASPVSSLLGRLVRLGRPSTRSRRFDANLRVTMAL